MATTIARSDKHERLYKNALVYAILFDLTSTALKGIGRVNTANKLKTATIVYDEITRQAKAK